MNAMFSALLRRSHAPIQCPHFSPYPHQPPPYAHGALIKSLIRETCTGREWQLREVISRYTLSSRRLSIQEFGPVSQASTQANKQVLSQSVSYLLLSVFTVPPRAHPSAALQTPSTFTITFKIVIILGKTHAQSRRAFCTQREC